MWKRKQFSVVGRVLACRAGHLPCSLSCLILTEGRVRWSLPPSVLKCVGKRLIQRSLDTVRSYSAALGTLAHFVPSFLASGFSVPFALALARTRKRSLSASGRVASSGVEMPLVSTQWQSWKGSKGLRQRGILRAGLWLLHREGRKHGAAGCSLRAYKAFQFPVSAVCPQGMVSPTLGPRVLSKQPLLRSKKVQG